MQQSETAIAEQRQIEQALVVAREGQRAAEDERRDAQERLAVAEAGAAVGGGDVDRGARKRLVAARDEVDFAQARVAGLEDRLRTAAAAANEARRVLAVEYRAWTRSQAETYVEQVYKPALGAILDAMRVLVGVGTALGVGRLLAIPRMAVVADPDDRRRAKQARHRAPQRFPPFRPMIRVPAAFHSPSPQAWRSPSSSRRPLPIRRTGSGPRACCGSPSHSILSEAMIKLSVMYPKSEDLKFDIDYYLDSHIPMMRRLIGERLKAFSVDRAAAGTDLPAPYEVIANLLFESLEAMQAALAEHGQALMADIPNYTNAQAVIQVSETSSSI